MKTIINFRNDTKSYMYRVGAIFIMLATFNLNIAKAQNNRRQNNGSQGERQYNRQGNGAVHGQDARSQQPMQSPNARVQQAPAQRPGIQQNQRVNGTAQSNRPYSANRTSPNAATGRGNVPVTNNANRNIPGNVNRNVAGNNRVSNRPVYSANNPSWRYSNLPRRNSVRTTIPATYRTVNYGGHDYRYYNGVFYRPYNNSFMVVAPPVGIYINVLPVGYRKIFVDNYPYYYYNGTFYDYRNDNYYVVSPPVGALVESLPPGYETVTIDGETYYTVDGAQYKPVIQDNGEIWYQVIKANY